MMERLLGEADPLGAFGMTHTECNRTYRSDTELIRSAWSLGYEEFLALLCQLDEEGRVHPEDLEES